MSGISFFMRRIILLCFDARGTIQRRKQSRMRIIAGKYRGRKLKSPPSLQTRPTSDRLRETLFNVLGPRTGDARFLDLCAGTGAVGIEALSRGASYVTFVDESRRMCSLIEANLEALGLADDFRVVTAEANGFLRRFVKKAMSPFDVIFFDPPYAADYETVLNFVGEHATRLLADGGVMIVEHDKKKELGQSFERLHKYREVRQGDSKLTFYERTAA